MYMILCLGINERLGSEAGSWEMNMMLLLLFFHVSGRVLSHCLKDDDDYSGYHLVLDGPRWLG